MLFRKTRILEKMWILKCGSQTGRGGNATRLGPRRPVWRLLQEFGSATMTQQRRRWRNSRARTTQPSHSVSNWVLQDERTLAWETEQMLKHGERKRSRVYTGWERGTEKLHTQLPGAQLHRRAHGRKERWTQGCSSHWPTEGRQSPGVEEPTQRVCPVWRRKRTRTEESWGLPTLTGQAEE